MPAPRITRPQLLAALCVALLALASAPAPAQPDDGEPTTFTLAEEAFRRGDYAGAVGLYERSIEEGIDHAFLHFHLGYALHVLGRVQEALPHHLRGVAINNREVRIDCIYNAACAHALLGHTDDAIRYLQHAIDAGFTDTQQVEGDADLDSLRGDPRFEALVDGIGVEPTLFEQLDFMVGRWEMRGDDGGVIHYRFDRPHERSAAIAYEVFGRTLAWAGSIVPSPSDRTWELTYCNDIGTTYRFVGEFQEGSVTFRGRPADVGGAGAHVRITYAPGGGGTLTEHAEVSDDGESWRLHHEVILVPVSADTGAAPAAQPGPPSTVTHAPAPDLYTRLDFLLGEWQIATHDRVLPFKYHRPVADSAAIFYESVHPRGLSWAGALFPIAHTGTWEWVYCDDRGDLLRFTGTATGDSVTWTGRQYDAGGAALNVRITQTRLADGRLLERSENSEDGVEWRVHHEDYLTPAGRVGP